MSSAVGFASYEDSILKCISKTPSAEIQRYMNSLKPSPLEEEKLRRREIVRSFVTTSGAENAKRGKLDMEPIHVSDFDENLEFEVRTRQHTAKPALVEIPEIEIQRRFLTEFTFPIQTVEVSILQTQLEQREAYGEPIGEHGACHMKTHLTRLLLDEVLILLRCVDKSIENHGSSAHQRALLDSAVAYIVGFKQNEL